MSEPLRILIAEDEAVIARRIARLATEILGPLAGETSVASRIDDAREAIRLRAPDVLILDLNLEGEDGFDLLRDLSTRSFDTIVISADRDRALEAFSLGIRDYIPKPFSRERLAQAFQRVLAPASRTERPVEHIGVRRDGWLEFIEIGRIAWIRGAGTRSELVLTGGEVVPHDKMLDRLEGMLPQRFERIHKSFIADVARIRRLVAHEGSRYSVELDDGTVLPVGRSRVSSLRARLA